MGAAGREALDLAYGAVSRLQTLLDGRGSLEVVDGELHAGGVVLTSGTALVDQVKAELGFGCSIFVGNVRIATTALTPDGSARALGMRASEKTTQQVVRCGKRFSGIGRILESEWVIVYAPLRDCSGKIVGMLAAYRHLGDFLHDLTLLDGTTEGLILHDGEGRIADANRAACDMLALSKQELLGKSMHEFTVTSDAALRAAWAEIGAAPLQLETYWRRSDVFEFPVELSVGRAELPGSTLLLTIARDFTEQHAARERLRALNAQLVQSEKMAALGKLVAGVTHDVNTPLGVIRSGHQTIAKAAAKLHTALRDNHPAALETNAVARSIRVIEQTMAAMDGGTARIDEVVRRLRSFARLDQGALQDVDLRTCIDEVLTILAHRVPDSVTVTTESAELPQVRCHPAEVNQLIMHLVVNALEAVGESGTVAVSASADDDLVELVVRDDGHGIAAPDLPNIFNPGFTTKGVGVGGGLGLAIAYQVAELHGGSISVESTQGAGACFTTRLPRTGAPRTGPNSSS